MITVEDGMIDKRLDLQIAPVMMKSLKFNLLLVKLKYMYIFCYEQAFIYFVSLYVDV